MKIGLGSLFQDFNDNSAALKKYANCNFHNPNSAELWNNIGMCYYGEGKFYSAISCLKKALYFNPMEWSIYFNLGLVYLAMEQYSSAFHFFLVTIKYNPNVGKTFMLLGICLWKLGDMENAYNSYARAIELDETDESIPLNFAIFQAENNQQDRAGEFYDKFNTLKAGKYQSGLPADMEEQVSIQKDILGKS